MHKGASHSETVICSVRLRCFVELHIIGFVTSAVLFRNFTDTTEVPLHGDEGQWISTSFYLEALLMRDFQPPHWFLELPNLDDATFPPWVRQGLAPTARADDAWRTVYWVLLNPR